MEALTEMARLPLGHVGNKWRFPGRPGALLNVRILVIAALPLLEPIEERAAHHLARLQHLLIARASRRQLERPHVLRPLAVRALVRLRLADRLRLLLAPPAERPHRYIRKTPKVVSGMGAFNAAEIPSASTRRVSSGSMMPSSHSRAVE